MGVKWSGTASALVTPPGQPFGQARVTLVSQGATLATGQTSARTSTIRARTDIVTVAQGDTLQALAQQGTISRLDIELVANLEILPAALAAGG